METGPSSHLSELIANVDFFAGLDDKIRNKICDACVTRQFSRGETVIRQGEMGLGLYLVCRGRVSVDREIGGQRITVAELGPSQFFGEMSLIDNKPRSATLTCVEDAECLLLTRDSFVRLMNKYPEIPIRIARTLAERMRFANEKLAAPPRPAPLKIFLCHSSNDKPAVRNLYKRLKAEGYAPWLDEENLIAGQDWQLEITKAVRGSDAVVVCLSRSSINKTGYVQKEIKYAVDANDERPDGAIFLVPLKLEECEIPERFKHLHYIGLFEEGGYEKLQRTLQLLASRFNPLL